MQSLIIKPINQPAIFPVHKKVSNQIKSNSQTTTSGLTKTSNKEESTKVTITYKLEKDYKKSLNRTK